MSPEDVAALAQWFAEEIVGNEFHFDCTVFPAAFRPLVVRACVASSALWPDAPVECEAFLREWYAWSDDQREEAEHRFGEGPLGGPFCSVCGVDEASSFANEPCPGDR